MARINLTRQKWLIGLQQQLQSGIWGQVVKTFFDEPLDPANEYPWEPCAIVKQNGIDRIIYIVLVEEISTDVDYKTWREWSRHNTYESALSAVARVRPWGFQFHYRTEH